MDRLEGKSTVTQLTQVFHEILLKLILKLIPV